MQKNRENISLKSWKIIEKNEKFQRLLYFLKLFIVIKLFNILVTTVYTFVLAYNIIINCIALFKFKYSIIRIQYFIFYLNNTV